MASLLDGVFAAAITPFDVEGVIDYEQLERHLKHLEAKGCQGALLSGTTGEGPSLSVDERIRLFEFAAARTSSLLSVAGTMTANLPETIKLTRAAYDAGLEITLLGPPFFFRQASDEGLFATYKQVLDAAVPSDGKVLLYHNPGVFGLGLSIDAIVKLRTAYPQQIIGIKDSSGDLDFNRQLCERLPDFKVLLGADKLLSAALAHGASGAMTAMSNLFPDLLIDVMQQSDAQARVDQAVEKFAGLPYVAAIKYLLKRGEVIENEAVRLPLLPLAEAETQLLVERFHLNATSPWSDSAKIGAEE
ncbi:MAG: dihydrodipicolinate synthase family protein [Chloroflexi bacterium]|nr:dihydrodipicolinate synthase family protein [Chloroflexota bacterium]